MQINHFYANQRLDLIRGSSIQATNQKLTQTNQKSHILENVEKFEPKNLSKNSPESIWMISKGDDVIHVKIN